MRERERKRVSDTLCKCLYEHQNVFCFLYRVTLYNTRITTAFLSFPLSLSLSVSVSLLYSLTHSEPWLPHVYPTPSFWLLNLATSFALLPNKASMFQIEYKKRCKKIKRERELNKKENEIWTMVHYKIHSIFLLQKRISSCNGWFRRKLGTM